MIFRVLIVAAMVLLLGCNSNQPHYKEEWSHNQLRYQQSVEGVSKRIESFHKEVTSIDSVSRKALLYKVCTAKVDGEDLWFPCDLDSARLASVFENLNTRDSLKAMESRVVHISYAAYVMRYGKNPVYSPLYQNDDGSYEALCASADGVNCDFLYANLVISKKMVPGRKDWSKRKFYRSIGKNLDEKNDLSLLLDSVYTGIVGPRDKPWLIPFEMCYKDGFAEPCQMDSAVVDSVRKVIENRGDTLVALSYQAGSLACDQFFKGAISDKHQCLSRDGEHCSELFALVRWNEKNRPVDTRSLGTYRFDLNEMTFKINHDLASDEIRYDGLSIYKKDGTFVGYGP